MRTLVWRALVGTLFLVLLLGVFALLTWIWLRPAQDPVTTPLFQGVVYQRLVRKSPRPLMIHVMTVSLDVPGVRLLTTAGDDSAGMDARALATTEFARREGAQVAINGSFFSPFHSRGPLSYYPHAGDPVNIHGLSVSDGERYSRDYVDLPGLCVTSERVFLHPRACPAPGLVHALAGGSMLVQDGKIVAPGDRGHKLHPRTALGLDAEEKILWMVVVDGRQKSYSEGVTRRELAALMVELGAHHAINLDGGGSSTMVAQEGGQWRVLNAPVHTGLPTRERPVGNHLGVMAPALEGR